MHRTRAKPKAPDTQGAAPRPAPLPAPSPCPVCHRPPAGPTLQEEPPNPQLLPGTAASGCPGARNPQLKSRGLTTFPAPLRGSGSTQRKREQRRERNRSVPQRTGAGSCEMPTEGTCSWLASSIPGSSTCTAGSPRQRADCIAAAGPCGDSGCSRSHPGGRKPPPGLGTWDTPRSTPAAT